MIARVWRAYTKPSNADKFEATLKPELLPGLGNLKGYRGSFVLRQPLGEEVEFVTVILWDSMEAILAVAGANYETAVVPPERRKLLAHYEPKAFHYEVASMHGFPQAKR